MAKSNDRTTPERLNALILSSHPVKAAMAHCDRDIIYQPQQVIQLLATVCATEGVKKVPFKATHARSRQVAWVKESQANYEWVWKHLVALLYEYTERYGEVYIYEKLNYHVFFHDKMPELPKKKMTPFVKIFPSESPFLEIPDPVKAYRAYYEETRSDMDWHRGKPLWMA